MQAMFNPASRPLVIYRRSTVKFGHLRKNVNLCMTSCHPDTTYFIRGSTEAYADGEVLNI